MIEYTYSKARRNFASLLEEARGEGEVTVRRKDGSKFVIKPVTDEKSPCDVPGVDLDLTREELVNFVRESRMR